MLLLACVWSLSAEMAIHLVNFSLQGYCCWSVSLLIKKILNSVDVIADIKFNTSIIQYEILDILEFTSDRKRMSVVVKDCQNEKILLLSKGADEAIFPLARSGNFLTFSLKKNISLDLVLLINIFFLFYGATSASYFLEAFKFIAFTRAWHCIPGWLLDYSLYVHC